MLADSGVLSDSLTMYVINYSSICLRGKDLRDLEGKSVSLHRAFHDEGINVTRFSFTFQDSLMVI
jgi:hypothetical protein